MEPFKNVYSPDSIHAAAVHIQRVYPQFNLVSFEAQCLQNLDALELKQRSRQIQQALADHLPKDIAQSANILCAALADDNTTENLTWTTDDTGIAGWFIMPMADYLAEYGIEQPEICLPALQAMTSRSSSEFAIRPFIHRYPELLQQEILTWASHNNLHVRRLASEGSRPRLPWGMRLPHLVNNPEPLRPILETLIDDPSEYVRRSVANNLNDIVKDHPQWVIDFAKKWWAPNNKPRHKLLRHACRTLFKQGNPQVLELFGYPPAKWQNARLKVADSRIKMGNASELTLQISAAATQRWMIDFVLHLKKANGSSTGKVFKWRDMQVSKGEPINISRKLDFKPVTTRKYYPGEHRVEVMINGKVVGEATFELES
ncbi:DNA alkylation repair protein [Salinibius halmophilus]|uniref:DNA alkylation repair protein n=1 Tax=Salinibius halmophilus TaxID=1853216 RepID=UPI0013145E6D|nr:DNA alkylation repair protein [Salinibius halmophilus]